MRAILEGAAQVLEREGYAAATTDRIAERAGVSVGSIYQYYPNKDAILLALARCHWLEGAILIAPVYQRLRDETPPLAEAVHDLVRASVDSHGRRPALHRVLYRETPIPPEMARGFAKSARATRKILVGYLERSPEVRVARPTLAAELFLQSLFHLSHLFALTPPKGFSRADTEREMEVMLLRYLSGEEPSGDEETEA